MKAKFWLSCSLASLALSALAQIRVNVDGRPVRFDTAGPMRMNGRVMVPLRGVMESLGASVDWNAAAQRIDVAKAGVSVSLNIGRRDALVDGRTVTLDSPATIVNGSTMIPLRFVGEALGAEVRWNESTSTVDIVSSGSNGNNNNDNNGAVSITSFRYNSEGWVRDGQTIDFTLDGSPNGTARVIVNGVDTAIPMREESAGHYVAHWKPTGSNRQVAISNASVMAELVVNGQQRLIQASNSLNVDYEKPRLRLSSPAANSHVQSRPTVIVTMDDGTGSGIDSRSVELKLNGRDVTRDATVTGEVLSYRPDNALAPGNYSLEARASDKAGNEAQQSWNFVVGDAKGPIESVSHDGTGALQPGQVITFTMMAEPKGKAYFSIGNRFRRGATEVSPGKYVADYTVKRNETFKGEAVTGYFTSNSGEQYSLASAKTLGTAGSAAHWSETTPAITKPAANDQVGSSFVIRGTAPGANRVILRIDYESSVIGGLKMRGPITEVSVDVDDNGNFQTDEIDASTPFNAKDVTYTITATAVDANNEKSKAATIKVRK